MDIHGTWRACAADTLLLRSWGDEFVAYHSLSGDTHLLDPVAGHILLALQQTASDTLTLCESLAPLLGIETDDEFMSQIEKILADLNTLTLIERG